MLADLKHASDCPAWGNYHRLMHTNHFLVALQEMSCHLGLVHTVTTRSFRTSFAFKTVLKGSIPTWRLAACMGHFSGNKDLSQKQYAPTLGLLRRVA